jgi:hypothetical protein
MSEQINKARGGPVRTPITDRVDLRIRDEVVMRRSAKPGREAEKTLIICNSATRFFRVAEKYKSTDKTRNEPKKYKSTW